MNSKEVLEKYPKIFKEFFDPECNVQNSCMVWGLEVPDEWLPTIDALCDTLQNRQWHRGNTKPPQVIAEQVKSKFNQLRFYYRLEWEEEVTEVQAEKYDGFVEGAIAMAEAAIYQIEKENDTKRWR